MYNNYDIFNIRQFEIFNYTDQKPCKGPFEGDGAEEWGARRGTDVLRYIKKQAANYNIIIDDYKTSILRKSVVVLMCRWKYSKGNVYE